MAMRHSVAMATALAAMALPWSVHASVQDGVEAWRGGDYARAVAEWQPLAQTGDPDAQFNLGQAYKLGRGVPQDMERARDLFGQAAQRGHLQAEANYGLILFQDGNREDAMPYIIRAANRGEPRAQYIYGTALFNGDHAPRDWPRAYAMMTNAAEAGLPQATASLEQMNSYIPLEQREEGIAMAERMAADSAATQVAVASPPAAPVPAPAPAPTPPSTFTPVPVPAPAANPPASPPPASPPQTQPAPTMTTAAPPPPPPPAPAPAARSGDWRIQLGSFRERARAETLWRTVSGRSSTLAGLQPYLVRAGPYTRLQAGPFQTRAEAQRACGAASRAGSECFTVRRR